MTWPFLLMALTAGILIPVQAGINALLGRMVGGAEAAAFISFVVGTVVLAAYLLVFRIPLPLGQTVAAAPWWYWTGGAFGAFFVAASVLLVPKLGAGVMISVIIAGQIVSSLALDHFGVLGYPVRPLDLQRIIGAAFLAAGVFLIKG
ncbi:MAG: DMT family transporter [Desulfovibrionaceae bacterium]|nr:DMT family transporter [Desulfovibrionaceae bacterium]